MSKGMPTRFMTQPIARSGIKAAIACLTIMCLADGELAIAEDLTEAHEDFVALCAECHGEDAKGAGVLTKNLTVPPPDLTLIRQRASGTYDEQAVFDWIIGLKMTDTHGSREMPIWGDWLMDEEMEDGTSMETAKNAEKEVARRVMAVVRYIETLQTDN